jgi:hypothetical protein
MSRIPLSLFLIACFFPAVTSSQVAFSQELGSSIPRSTNREAGRRDSIAVAPGDIALAAFLAPVRPQAIRTTAVDNSGLGLSVCAGRGRWKCILGGAALGFIGGALIGNAFIPHEVGHTEYGCDYFFGTGCHTYAVCDAHCDEPVTKIWTFGFGGALLGGLGGYYLAKASNR